MPNLEKPDSHLTAVKWRFPSVHPEGRKFVLIAAVATLVVYSVVSPFIGWLHFQPIYEQLLATQPDMFD